MESSRGKVIAIKGVILLNANNNCLVVKVFPQHDLQVSTSVRFVLSFQVVLEHFLQKMYIMITDVVGEKRINLAYPIWNLDSSMFSNNIQYQRAFESTADNKQGTAAAGSGVYG